jgi:Family of unknown function (DUF6353)
MNVALIRVAQKAPGLSKALGRTSLKLKKNSPHIMFGAGLAGMVTSTVLACRATLNLSDTLDQVQSDIYNARGADRDITYAYVKSAGRLGRLYGPSIGVGLVSIGLLSRSHYNLTRQNANLMAAYAALQAGYESYRARVRAELGDDRELALYRGLVAGGDSDSDDIPCLTDPNELSPYAKFFDEYSPHFVKDAEKNRLYLQCQQNYANERLRAYGHLFLNEVYDMIGVDRTPAGAVVGWVISEKGDNYVDFGMFHPSASPFINGWENSVLLDFNVDGVIYDKI